MWSGKETQNGIHFSRSKIFIKYILDEIFFCDSAVSKIISGKNELSS